MNPQETLVYKTLPLMAEIYDDINGLTLDEARKLLRESSGDDWINSTVEAVGREKLMNDRPSWYFAFVKGEEGDIGNDNMSELVSKYMKHEHAIMEIAMYIALNRTNMYHYILSTKLEYDLVEGFIQVDETQYPINTNYIDEKLKDNSDNEEQLKVYFENIGQARENILIIGKQVKKELERR
ncbi:hypothetical protein [Bacillus thuringiensis]|uniref:hypothetical protein n=1 Tax=Bacillus thuringiensis TaxID=1428 RepID=UPI000CD9D980|nr:hypothetical protein [Bacillus thuringiensis]